jgi:hypothetical protein
MLRAAQKAIYSTACCLGELLGLLLVPRSGIDWEQGDYELGHGHLVRWHRGVRGYGASAHPGVMQLVATGMLNKQVGAELSMAEKTVKTHRAHMMQKLGITSVAELMVVLQKAEVPPPARPGTKVSLRSANATR